ncbi:MAG TPA: metallophosphoesterase [Polyangiaceae bacterium]|nr:metallophosphoesterase [Polyangiaceae bacterium]
MTFQANRAYDPALDVRTDYRGLDDRLRQAPAGGAHLWLLVAPRRGRKTWTLKAMERLLAPAARYVDLRHGRLPADARPGDVFLLDEPLGLLEKGQGPQLLADCGRLHRAGARVAMAVTPLELERLRACDEGRGQVSDNALRGIEPFSAEEAKALAKRSARAGKLLAQLRGDLADWKRSAFLLELLFEIDEASPRRDVRELLRAALERCRQTDIQYFDYVFLKGLTGPQRGVVRKAARGEPLAQAECGVLLLAGLLERGKAAKRPRLADPVLSAHFSPLRIHHVSDVHVGPKAAAAIDAKAGGRVAAGADPGPLRNTYVQHLKSLRAKGEAPHLVVISGDLTEWATGEQLAEARAWVEQVRDELAEHVQLGPEDPRVLVVGGNHDVDWTQSRAENPSARHRPFAEAFRAYRPPRLEVPPEGRPVAAVSYPDFGLELLLLGSAEYGGEVDDDQRRDRLLREIADIRDPAAPGERERAEKAALDAARFDPGLVHDKDLERAAAHPWAEPVRIAVLHHPVSPLPPVTEIAPYAGLLNAGAVKDTLLKSGFCLILHGHAHSGWFGIEEWPGLHEGRKLRIAAAPSLSSRETLQHLGFNSIEILRDRDDRGEPHYRVVVRRHLRQGAQNWQAVPPEMSFVPGS